MNRPTSLPAGALDLGPVQLIAVLDRLDAVERELRHAIDELGELAIATGVTGWPLHRAGLIETAAAVATAARRLDDRLDAVLDTIPDERLTDEELVDLAIELDHAITGSTTGHARLAISRIESLLIAREQERRGKDGHR